MSSINQKLGLRPRTRTRGATKAKALVTDAQCPACRSQYVIATPKGQLMCGKCSHFWTPEAR
jgi:ribosomal protein S27AE